MQSEQQRQRRREQKRFEREREKKEARKAQMCAGDELEFRLPLRVASLFGRAMRVAREEAGRPISPGECLVRMARHFIDVWGPRMAQRSPCALTPALPYLSPDAELEEANRALLCRGAQVHVPLRSGQARVAGELLDRLRRLPDRE